ncbi:hypothetical protein V8F33_001010 [Rhypophila sp. PSN 637]
MTRLIFFFASFVFLSSFWAGRSCGPNCDPLSSCRSGGFYKRELGADIKAQPPWKQPTNNPWEPVADWQCDPHLAERGNRTNPLRQLPPSHSSEPRSTGLSLGVC